VAQYQALFVCFFWCCVQVFMLLSLMGTIVGLAAGLFCIMLDVNELNKLIAWLSNCWIQILHDITATTTTTTTTIWCNFKISSPMLVSLYCIPCFVFMALFFVLSRKSFLSYFYPFSSVLWCYSSCCVIRLLYHTLSRVSRCCTLF